MTLESCISSSSQIDVANHQHSSPIAIHLDSPIMSINIMSPVNLDHNHHHDLHHNEEQQHEQTLCTSNERIQASQTPEHPTSELELQLELDEETEIIVDSPKRNETETATTTTHHRTPDSSARFTHVNRHRRQDRCVTEVQLDRLNALIKIIRNGNYNEFLQLLERSGFKNLLNVFVDGQTALHYSLIYGRSLAWCKQLILNGANPNLTNRAGWHPIHLAAFNGSRETMRYLIDCIAN